MSASHRSSVFFLSKRNDKISKLTFSISAVASLVLVAVVLYISYHTNKYGFLKENDPVPDTHHTEKLTDEQCEDVCTTKDCLYAASNIVEKLDSDVDPCDDFYHFACGNWVKKFGKKDNASVMDELEDILKLRIKEVLEEIKPVTGTAVGKLKVVYDSCISKSASELHAISTALEFLEKIGIPNWPRLDDDFRFGNPSLEEAIAIMTVYDLNAFFKPAPDLPEEATQWNVNISHPSQHLNLTVYFDKSFNHMQNLEIGKDVATQLFAHFGLEDDEINRTVTEFEGLNNEITQRRLVAMEEEQKCYKNASLCPEPFHNCSAAVDEPMRFVCRVIYHFLRITDLSEVYSTENLKFDNYADFEILYDVLRKSSHRTIAHHLALTFFYENLANLNFLFPLLARKHPRIFGATRIYPLRDIRWKHCVQWVSRNMPSVLTMAYVPRKFPKSDREEIKSIFDVIKNETYNTYRENTWFENPDLQHLITEKMSKVSYFIDKYVDYMLDEQHLNSYYEDFHPTHHSYLTNMLEFKRHYYMYLMKRVQFEENTMFQYDPFLVNAYYHYSENRIDLLFGVLIPPLYIHGRPRSLNIASLGSFIGHEFGHELDSIFSNFIQEQNDLQGSEERNSEDLMLRHKTRVKCLIDQYDKFKIEQLDEFVNGTKTFHENFADSFSIAWAENARLQYLANLQTPEVKLPTPYTNEEAFYIVYAQHWCNVRSDESAIEQVHFDMHSPQELRVLGTLSNSRRFSEVFHCPVGSRMNPAQKCSFLI